VLVAAGVEVGRQVLVGISVAVGALDPDLLAAELLAQDLQHADLVGDAVDPRPASGVALQHGIAPGDRHHAHKRHLFGGWVAPHSARGVPGDNGQGVEHGSVRLIAGAEGERAQHERQHAAVMGAVGVVDYGLEVPTVARPCGFPLGHEVVQGPLADRGEDHVAHGAVRAGHAGGGELVQQRGLADDALEAGD